MRLGAWVLMGLAILGAAGCGGGDDDVSGPVGGRRLAVHKITETPPDGASVVTQWQGPAGGAPFPSIRVQLWPGRRATDSREQIQVRVKWKLPSSAGADARSLLTAARAFVAEHDRALAALDLFPIEGSWYSDAPQDGGRVEAVVYRFESRLAGGSDAAGVTGVRNSYPVPLDSDRFVHHRTYVSLGAAGAFLTIRYDVVVSSRTLEADFVYAERTTAGMPAIGGRIDISESME